MEQRIRIRTTVCGVFSPGINFPPKQPPSCEEGRSTKAANAYCCICLGWFRGKNAVLDHFESCVRLNGNPQSHCWDDHPSCQGYKPRMRRTGHTANQASAQMNRVSRSSRPPTHEETSHTSSFVQYPQFPSSQGFDALPPLRQLETRTPQLSGSQVPFSSHGSGAKNGYTGVPLLLKSQLQETSSHTFLGHDLSRFPFDFQNNSNGVQIGSTSQDNAEIGMRSLDWQEADSTAGGGPLSFGSNHGHDLDLHRQ